MNGYFGSLLLRDDITHLQQGSRNAWISCVSCVSKIFCNGTLDCATSYVGVAGDLPRWTTILMGIAHHRTLKYMHHSIRPFQFECQR
ncbi:hypothetical protein CYMTET_8840 [Cymbomonas tetramitiformis]|uniref:Uncharacterized protein n=1 Tax=Cymbomonas tetramitiformis TaxID=36881 RepID=A0AAE0GS73_9CHLO|nr:hypothetical protein CYMTET_8840 [Cymbomonas tetramitiformis]